MHILSFALFLIGTISASVVTEVDFSKLVPYTKNTYTLKSIYQHIWYDLYKSCLSDRLGLKKTSNEFRAVLTAVRILMLLKISGTKMPDKAADYKLQIYLNKLFGFKVQSRKHAQAAKLEDVMTPLRQRANKLTKTGAISKDKQTTVNLADEPTEFIDMLERALVRLEILLRGSKESDRQ
jgi:hypothetical protein